MSTDKKLKKSANRMIFGVCGGVAEHFNVDPTIVRVVWAVLGFFYGTGLILYLILALVMPKANGSDPGPLV